MSSFRSRSGLLGARLSDGAVSFTVSVRMGVNVLDDDWAMLLADIPRVLYPDWDDEGEVVWPCNGETVQLRDTVTGQRVQFYPDGKGVGITVSVPDDPEAAARLRSILKSQRTKSFSLMSDHQTGGMGSLEEALWHPAPGSAGVTHADGLGEERDYRQRAREWRTGWRHTANYRDEIAAAIVAVLRDGLRTTPADLRLSAYSDYGPDRIPRVGTVAPDRPTSRGLSPQCSDWDEFADRLEWVLTTLPGLGCLNLSIPGRSLSIQLSRESDDAIRGVCWPGADPGTQELNNRLSGLGWLWGIPFDLQGVVDEGGWITPPAGTGTAHPTMHHPVTLTIATLRTIGGASQPREVAFEAFSNLAGVGDMSYLGAELGIPHA
ncbi:hypothetical protein APR12_004367 [Nocardia amikacinitolerans]|nr:hypothetical protein [Nocardia amikacinitolerans]